MDAKNFKIWLTENDMDNNELFRESLKCYSINANRASYLLSYLGFLDYIKNLIIQFDGVPNSYKEESSDECAQSKWKKRKENLYIDSKWEEQVIGYILENDKSNIFRLKNEIIKEFETKRIIRNACAHNKKRPVTTSTIEDLWDFIVYSNPYFVINGTDELFKENLQKILDFLSFKDYKEEIKVVYNYYSKLQNNEREKCFDFLLKLLEEKITELNSSEALKRLNILLEYVLENKENEEYIWIKNKDKAIDIYFFLNLEGYNDLRNEKKDIIKYSYENSDDIIEILYKSTNNCKINNFIFLIYLDNNFFKWWNILDKVTSKKYDLVLEKEIKEILIDKNNIMQMCKNLECLYYYNNGYTTKSTNTLDFLKYHEYLNKIKIIFELMIEFNIENEYINDLKSRCKKILGNEHERDNFGRLFDLFENNRNLSDWIHKA
ncbi:MULTISPECIES: hypothetical protein [Peptoniphilaceae]|uniref:hypothetical protein n=1 Tax=Peptoniphilaceae TaxID=1570339 RepID=UPI00031800E4|nr:hypothetical protein [Peptoniphilus senegalensis]